MSPMDLESQSTEESQHIIAGESLTSERFRGIGIMTNKRPDSLLESIQPEKTDVVLRFAMLRQVGHYLPDDAGKLEAVAGESSRH